MLEKIASVIGGVVLAVSSFFGFGAPQEAPEEPLFGEFTPAGGTTYRLKTSVGTTDTTIVLSSLKIDGNPVTMSTLNTDIAYATLDPQSATRKEFISFTTITQNSDGSATLTGVTRGLASSFPFTASSTLRKAHPGQSILILSDSPQVFNEYTKTRSDVAVVGNWTFPTTTSASSSNSAVTKGYFENTAMLLTTNQSASGNKTFSGNTTLSGSANAIATTTIISTTIASGTITKTPVANLDITNKAYVDGVAVAGASNANETTKGIVEQATDAEIIARTGTGATGAVLFNSNNDIDVIASSTIQTYFASSTNQTLVLNDIQVNANDYVTIYSTTYGSALGGGTITGTLILFNGASTTLSSSGQTSNTQGSFSMMGFYRATTTQTIRITNTPSGSINYTDLLVQVFRR